MGEYVLTEAEKRAGCVLVDLGAETTTVSVYYRDKLRNIAVIPLGNNNITKDLESLQMDEVEAEAMKLKYGSAYTEIQDIDPNMVWSIDGSRSVSSRKFIEVVEARMLEIIENVRNLIPSEYMDKLLGGIVLTGGGSNMRNIDKAFRKAINIEKVRIAKSVNININVKDSKPALANNGTMNTILSLLAKGDMNCAGNAFNDSLFDEEQLAAATQTAATAAQIAAEKAKAEEEERLRKEKEAEEEERKRKEKEAEEERQAAEKKEKSVMHRIFGSLKQFGRSLVEPEPGSND